MSFLFDKPIKEYPSLQDRLAIKAVNGEILNIYVGAIIEQLFDMEQLGNACLAYPTRDVTDCETGEVTTLPLQIADVLFAMETALCEAINGGTINIYAINNLGDGAQVYKDLTVVGITKTFNQRSFKSDTIAITQDDDHIYIETSIIDLEDFIVDTRFSEETYDEKGTYAKPYKNLDNAILAYIGTGTRAAPQFGGSRILCIGGQGHNFTQNLSINGLVLEVELGTSVSYQGADLYMVDYRTLQTSLGGYGNQTVNISIKLQGFGTVSTNKLFAYVVNSGSLVSSTGKRNNVFTVDNLNVFSFYKTADFVTGITRSNGNPWMSNNGTAKFYFGGVEEAMVVSEGFGASAISDNSNTGNTQIKGALLLCVSQQVIRVLSGYVGLEETTLTNNFQDTTGSYITADNAALSGNVLTEDASFPLRLPNPKSNLCLIDVYGSGQVFIENSLLTKGFEITYNEAWYRLNSDTSFITILNSNTTGKQGHVFSYNIIKTGAFHPTILLKNNDILAEVGDPKGFMGTSVNPFIKGTFVNNIIQPPIDNNIDLTRANTATVVNNFNNKLKESIQVYFGKYNASVAGLTLGNVFINRQTINAFQLVFGEEYKIVTLGTGVNWNAMGVIPTPAVGVYFTYNGTAFSGTGGTTHKDKRDILT